jgi:hypothetical protein
VRTISVSKWTHVISLVAAVVSAAILAYISIIWFTPMRRNLRYPAGEWALLAGIILAFVLSIVAAKLNKIWWYALTAWALIIFVYLAVFYKPPMWV